MRTINETFENSEFEELQKVKERSGKNWHDLIMTLVEKDEKRGETKEE
jgi:hypothetical protein